MQPNTQGLIKLFDNVEKVGEVRKGHRCKMVVSLVAKDGIKCLYLADFKLKITNMEWTPTGKTFLIPLEVPVTPDHLSKQEGASQMYIERTANALIDLIDLAYIKSDDFSVDTTENALYIEPYGFTKKKGATDK